MTLARSLALAVTTVLLSCSDREVRSTATKTTGIDWIPATKTIQEYAAENPDRLTVAAFTMKWDPIGKLFLKHIESNQLSLFGSKKPLFLEYDCSNEASLGRKQLEQMNVAYLPVVYVSHRARWQHSASPNEFLNDPNHPKEYLIEVTRIVESVLK